MRGGEEANEVGRQRQPVAALLLQGSQGGEGFAAAGVAIDENDAAVGAGFEQAAGQAGDGQVERERAGMKQVERPDVECAAGQVNPSGSGSVQSHRERKKRASS